MSEWQPLSDVQWMNIVNHDNAWHGWSKEDAIHEVVKMVEAKLRDNNGYTLIVPMSAPKGTLPL